MLRHRANRAAARVLPVGRVDQRVVPPLRLPVAVVVRESGLLDQEDHKAVAVDRQARRDITLTSRSTSKTF